MSEKCLKVKCWRIDEEAKILEVWRDNIKNLRSAKRNSHVYERMSKELLEMGVKATAKEIQRKVNNLTQRYRKEKKLMGNTGGSPSNWKHFQSVHALIGALAANDNSKMHESVNRHILENSANNESASISESQFTMDDFPSEEEICLSHEFETIYTNSPPDHHSSPPLLRPSPSPTTPPPSATPELVVSSSRGNSSRSTKAKKPVTERLLEEIKTTNDLVKKDSADMLKLMEKSIEIDMQNNQLMKDFINATLRQAQRN